jgi:hypothetical protein
VVSKYKMLASEIDAADTEPGIEYERYTVSTVNFAVGSTVGTDVGAFVGSAVGAFVFEHTCAHLISEIEIA